VRLLLLLGSLGGLVIACDTTSPAPSRLAEGTWGGAGLELTVRANDASFAIGCGVNGPGGRGYIAGPILVDASGHFDAPIDWAVNPPGPPLATPDAAATPAPLPTPPLTRFRGTLDGQTIRVLPPLGHVQGDILTLGQAADPGAWGCP
jgi:hypothetical protein